MDISEVISRIGDFSRDAVLITEAEPYTLPGPRILWVNTAFTEMTGYSPEEVIGRTPRLLQGEDFDPEAGRNIHDALEHWRPVRQVVRNYTKDRRGVWIELDITPIADEDGWFHYWLAIQRDVTERVEYEHKLAEAERRFELAATASLIGVWDWDLRTNSLYWSDEFCAMVGIRRDQFTGDFTAFDCRLHPDDRDRVHQALEAHFSDAAPFEIEYRLKHAEGRYIDVKARGAVQRGADGTMIRMIGSVQDVTEERDRERALSDAKSAAEAANHAKSQFLANMSHEIRTPLNGVLGVAQLMARTELSEKQARYVDLIETSGRTLRMLIDDVLDISRIEAGRLNLVEAQYCPAEAIRDAADAVAAAAEAKGLALRVRLAPDLPPGAVGDAKRFSQILINLAGNAVKFTEAGSVDIEAGRAPDGGLQVVVRDTGVGIAPELIEKVFDRFQQADTSNTREHGGAGLGLAIAQGLAQAMGGEISVASTRGAGSDFTLSLPLDAARASQAGQADAAIPEDAETAREDAPAAEAEPTVLEFAPEPAPRTKVLIAEDNEINLEVLSELLAQDGIETVIARDGVQALEALGRDPAIGLVLLDLQMPRLSGEGVLAHMRRSAAPLDTLPVLVVSANAGADTGERVRGLGADGFISKPFEPDAVVAAVRAGLDGASATLAGGGPAGLAGETDAARRQAL